jgi:hypothetical protein
MGINKLCSNDENARRLDKFITENMRWMRISYTAEVEKRKLKELLPMLVEHIGNARDDEREDVFVLNPEKPQPAFVLAIGAGKAKRSEVKHGNFMFIKDGETGDFGGENDVISLGEWALSLHFSAVLGE